jgi:hypothetical protein
MKLNEQRFQWPHTTNISFRKLIKKALKKTVKQISAKKNEPQVK